MNFNLNVGQNNGNVADSQLNLGQTTVEAAADTTTKPVLGGDNVTVNGSTDFEKLIAKLQSEREEKNSQIFAIQFAGAMAVLIANQTGISDAQKAILQQINTATAELEELSKTTNTELTEYNDANDELNQLKSQLGGVDAELAVLTAQLEALVNASVTTPEEREENLRKQEEVKAQIAEQESKKAALNDKITAQEKVVEEKEAAYTEANNAAAAKKGELNVLYEQLEVNSIKVVCNAVRSAAKNLMAAFQLLIAANSVGEGDESTLNQVNSIIEALGEYADKLEEMSQEELEEATKKIAQDVSQLIELQLTVKAGDLPETKDYV